MVFGSGLGEQDQHLVDALNRNPSRPIAISIRKDGRSDEEVRLEKRKIRAGLDAPLYFFDSSTHPLVGGR